MASAVQGTRTRSCQTRKLTLTPDCLEHSDLFTVSLSGKKRAHEHQGNRGNAETHLRESQGSETFL